MPRLADYMGDPTKPPIVQLSDALTHAAEPWLTPNEKVLLNMLRLACESIEILNDRVTSLTYQLEEVQRQNTSYHHHHTPSGYTTP